MTPQELNEYINGKRHAGYEKALYLYESLRKPAEGVYPEWDIASRRATESVYTQEFRRNIFVELAKETFSQIFTCISKIRRSSDWSVEFPKDNPTFIPEKETLRSYTEKYFPYYTTFESYVFSVLLKNYLIDANAVCVVKPITTDLKENEYAKPYPYFYNAEEVLDFKENEYAVLRIRHHHYLGKNPVEETKYIVVDAFAITTYARKGDKGFIIEDQYVHGLGIMPAFKMRGRFFKNYDGYTVNESPIQTVAPRLKEFEREYSDLQGAVFQHLFPQKWQWATQLCLYCQGAGGISTGKIWIDERGRKTDKATKKQVVCPECHGQGQIASSPFMNMVIRPSKKNTGEQDAPIPPGGFLTVPIDIVELQDKRCNDHVYKALCSINMQFLMKVPLTESGYAKDVDREELNNFAYGCAEDIVWMMDRLYYLFAKYRYRAKSDGQSLSDDEINKLLPKVAVPQKFDLVSSNFLVDEIKKAKEAALNPLIMAQLNMDYASKHFYDNQEARDLLKLTLRLDPLPGLSDEDKMLRLSNGGLQEIDYIASCYIYPFVVEALEDDPNFPALTFAEQQDVIMKMALAKQKLINGEKEEEPKPEEIVRINGIAN